MRDYQTLFIPDNYIFSLTKTSRKIGLSDAVRQTVEEVWEQEQAKLGNALFNGQLLSLVDFDRQGLEAEFVEYKLYLAFLRRPELRQVLNIKPISISCLTKSSDSVLIGRREESVAQYPLWYELVPSGGIDSDAVKGDRLDVVGQALRELEEETGIARKEVVKIRPFTLIFDPDEGLYEVCVEIELTPKMAAENLNPTPEYSSLEWVAPSQLSNFIEAHKSRMVPISIYLLELYNLY